MRHPQCDIATGLRQIGPRALIVDGQGMELQENRHRVGRERVGRCPGSGPRVPRILPRRRGSGESVTGYRRRSTEGLPWPMGARVSRDWVLHRCLYWVTEGKDSGSSRPRAVHDDVILHPPGHCSPRLDLIVALAHPTFWQKLIRPSVRISLRRGKEISELPDRSTGLSLALQLVTVLRVDPCANHSRSPGHRTFDENPVSAADQFIAAFFSLGVRR
jgi:hypothetical protein